jgi:uncharacterized protein (DUF305 family)
MRKRLIALGLAGVLGLTVTACGSGTPSTTTSTTTASTSQTIQPTSTTTP